jgi:muramoyltetrapeptide carboxypeptidase
MIDSGRQQQHDTTSRSPIEPVRPPRLRPGDTVAVVVPAGPVPEDRLRAGLAVLGARYRLRVADDILRADGYLAGDDARRAGELMAALGDPDVRAVFCARGGYGAMRILPLLDPAVLRADPKPIVGFSDITALLAWALRAAGVCGVHGPVVAQLGELPPGDVAALFALLEGAAPAGPIAAPLRLGTAATASGGRGRIEGRLVGGNLALIAGLLGTPWAIEPDGALYLIEDVGERPYAIDRYLTHIALAGGFAGVRGAAIGDLTRCDERSIAGSADAISVVGERLAAAGLPGLGGLPVGHGARNLALPFGGRAALDLDAGALELVDAAVA